MCFRQENETDWNPPVDVQFHNSHLTHAVHDIRIHSHYKQRQKILKLMSENARIITAVVSTNVLWSLQVSFEISSSSSQTVM